MEGIINEINELKNTSLLEESSLMRT